MAKTASIVDETAVTEISIRPDGRVYVFGMSHEVLDVLAALCPDDPAIHQRLRALSTVSESAAKANVSE